MEATTTNETMEQAAVDALFSGVEFESATPAAPAMSALEIEVNAFLARYIFNDDVDNNEGGRGRHNDTMPPQGPMFDEQGEPFDWRLYQAGINENNYYPGIEEDIYDDDDDDDY